MSETKVDELQNWLAGLPDTADGIAEHLREQGFTGLRDTAGQCPLALAASAALGADIIIGDETASVLPPPGKRGPATFVPMVALPSAAAAFVVRLDAGDYPDLEVENQEVTSNDA